MSAVPASAPIAPLAVRVENLSISFPSGTPVAGVSFEARAGEIVGLVGESGSGKSLCALSLARLLPPQARATGIVRVLGHDVLTLRQRALTRFRGREIAVVFQEPMTALNPTLTISSQMTGVTRRHLGIGKRDAIDRARAQLRGMRLDDADRVLSCYPHQLSGGMRQRVLLAMAFSCSPKLLVCDEPTTALDVSVQGEIVELIRQTARKAGTTVLFISHDLGIVSHLCDRLYVMYQGRIVEGGPTSTVLTCAAHPYTCLLLASRPQSAPPRSRLTPAAPSLPRMAPSEDPCAFAPRCPRAHEVCARRPELVTLSRDALRSVACWRPLSTVRED